MADVKDKGKETMEVVEEARQKEWAGRSFARGLFLGDLLSDLIFPYPVQCEEDKKIGDDYLVKVEAFLRENLDPDEADRTAELPRPVIDGLMRLGCFGMKIPKEYGGLGFSQVNYNRVISLVATYCGSTAIWLSAHQSIGVPNPLKLFGTEEQKRKYLPRLASGDISAFALTEVGVGSDPANMATTGVPSEDGNYYILNGEKLWSTNANVAGVIIVMAQTPPHIVKGKEKKQITAFIVETDTPGFEVEYRCDFLGCRAIKNGILRFNRVMVPKENILGNLGDGLKIALTTLNNGRLTLAAACTGVAKLCLNIARQSANERVQWGAPIGKHDATAAKIARIAADAFAMEAVSHYASSLADLAKRDFRLEAAMAKLFCSEAGWRVVDETLQIRGGRGYEKAESLRGRGEKAYPVERMLRDMRVNRIIEGTSEIMRLFIAREALDWHMKILMPLAHNPRFSVAMKAFGTYAVWFLRVLRPTVPFNFRTYGFYLSYGRFRRLERALVRHLKFAERASKRLARTIYFLMVRHQLGLEKKQRLLGRVVDIGVDLFAITASCSRAESLIRLNGHEHDLTNRQIEEMVELVDLFCREARKRIKRAFEDIFDNNDRQSYRIAQQVLNGDFAWMEDEIIKTE